MRKLNFITMICILLLIQVGCSLTISNNSTTNNDFKYHKAKYLIINEANNKEIGNMLYEYNEGKTKSITISKILYADFLESIGEDVKNKRVYSYNSKNQLINYLEEEYIGTDEAHLHNELNVSYNENCTILNNDLNSQKKKIILPPESNIFIENYFQLMLTPINISKSCPYYFYINNKGYSGCLEFVKNIEIKNDCLGNRMTTELFTAANAKTNVWVDNELSVIVQIEETTDNLSIKTILYELEE